MRHYILFSAIALAFTVSAAAQVTSTFSSTDEGWVGVDLSLDGPYDALTNGPFAVNFSGSGGNPGGFITVSDNNNTDGAYFFQAPAAFIGNQSASYGGSLSFSAMTNYSPPSTPYTDADVVLVGGGLTLVANAGPDPVPGVWTPYTVSLFETPWRKGTLAGAVPSPAEMQTVLGNLTALRIRGEYGFGNDNGALDSVTLMVPEPAGTLVTATALASLAALCRRRERL